jgi:hypothetical protein
MDRVFVMLANHYLMCLERERECQQWRALSSYSNKRAFYIKPYLFEVAFERTKESDSRFDSRELLHNFRISFE